jgi:hypothetical protein
MASAALSRALTTVLWGILRCWRDLAARGAALDLFHRSHDDFHQFINLEPGLAPIMVSSRGF